MSEKRLIAAIRKTDNPMAAAGLVTWLMAHVSLIPVLIAGINKITSGKTAVAKWAGVVEVGAIVAAAIDELSAIVATPPGPAPAPVPAGGDVFAAVGAKYGAALAKDDKRGSIAGIITLLPLLMKYLPMIIEFIKSLQATK